MVSHRHGANAPAHTNTTRQPAQAASMLATCTQRMKPQHWQVQHDTQHQRSHWHNAQPHARHSRQRGRTLYLARSSLDRGADMILARDVESAVKCALRALRRDEETRGLNFMVTARTTCTTTPAAARNTEPPGQRERLAQPSTQHAACSHGAQRVAMHLTRRQQSKAQRLGKPRQRKPPSSKA